MYILCNVKKNRAPRIGLLSDLLSRVLRLLVRELRSVVNGSYGEVVAVRRNVRGH